jgi:hypothetical protein
MAISHRLAALKINCTAAAYYWGSLAVLLQRSRMSGRYGFELTHDALHVQPLHARGSSLREFVAVGQNGWHCCEIWRDD